MKKYFVVFLVIIMVSSTALGAFQGWKKKPDTQNFAQHILKSVSYVPLPKPSLIYSRNGQSLFEYDLDTMKHKTSVIVTESQSKLPMNLDDVLAAVVLGVASGPTAWELLDSKKEKKLKLRSRQIYYAISTIASVVSGYSLGYSMTAPSYTDEEINRFLSDDKNWENVAKIGAINSADGLKRLIRLLGEDATEDRAIEIEKLRESVEITIHFDKQNPYVFMRPWVFQSLSHYWCQALSYHPANEELSLETEAPVVTNQADDCNPPRHSES